MQSLQHIRSACQFMRVGSLHQWQHRCCMILSAILDDAHSDDAAAVHASPPDSLLDAFDLAVLAPTVCTHCLHHNAPARVWLGDPVTMLCQLRAEERRHQQRNGECMCDIIPRVRRSVTSALILEQCQGMPSLGSQGAGVEAGEGAEGAGGRTSRHGPGRASTWHQLSLPHGDPRGECMKTCPGSWRRRCLCRDVHRLH